jgi:hypothetical protein
MFDGGIGSYLQAVFCGIVYINIIIITNYIIVRRVIDLSRSLSDYCET